MSPEELVDRARSLVRNNRRALLGIAGSPGAGKTTLAERLVRRLRDTPPPGGLDPGWVVYLPMDGFHLADVELDRLGRRHRKGAPDTFDAAGYAALLRRLREDRDPVVYAPAFERTLEQPIAGSIPVSRAARLVVTEGNYLLLDDADWVGVRRQLDEVWFCELDETERIRRLVARHKQFGKDHDTATAWVAEVDQANADLVSGSRCHAALIIPQALSDAFVRSSGPGGPPIASTQP